MQPVREVVNASSDRYAALRGLAREFACIALVSATVSEPLKVAEKLMFNVRVKEFALPFTVLPVAVTVHWLFDRLPLPLRGILPEIRSPASFTRYRVFCGRL